MKKTVTAILAAVLALSFMLTACSKGGETSGDNSTGGTSSTAGTTSGNADSIDTTKPHMKDGKAIYPNVPDYNEYFSTEFRYEEGMERIELGHERLTKITGVDVESAIDGAIEKYGKYFLDYIPDYVLKAAVRPLDGGPVLRQEKGNITGVTDDAVAQVNEFLKGNSKELLDIEDPEQNVAAFAVAAMLFHENADKADLWRLIEAFVNTCCYNDEAEGKELAGFALYSTLMEFIL